MDTKTSGVDIYDLSICLGTDRVMAEITLYVTIQWRVSTSKLSLGRKLIRYKQDHLNYHHLKEFVYSDMMYLNAKLIRFENVYRSL